MKIRHGAGVSPGLVVALLAMMVPCSVEAANISWDNSATNFNDGGSWVGNVAPGTADRAIFDTTAVTQPNLFSSLTIQGLSFTVTGYNLTSSNTSTALTLTNTGATTTTAALNLAASVAATIDAPIVLGAAAGQTQTFLSGSGSDLSLNGVISSTNAIAGLTLGSSGIYRINGANTYQGTTTQSSFSRIIIGNAQAFSTGTLSLQSASAGLEASINLTGSNKINNNIIWGANATLFDSGSNAIQFAGNVDLNGAARTITSQVSGGATFDGVISNDGGNGLTFTLSNGSAVTLNGINTYTGATIISSAAVNAGSIYVSNIGNAGVAGNLGAGTTITVGTGDSSRTGRLIYTGAGESTSKVINLGGTAASAYIEHAGTGTLAFTANSTATGLGNKTLTLAGSTSGVGRFEGQIVNSTGFATSLTKSGTGRWVLTGANSYTGNTAINAGVLEASDSVGLPTASLLQLRGGVLQTSGTITRTLGTAAGNMNWAGSSGGFAARGGNLILNLNSGTGSITWGNTSTNIGGTELIFGSTTADSRVDLQNAVNLGSGLRSIRVNDNTSSTTDVARLSGVLSGASGGIVKEGAGVLELTGTNTYGSSTTVNAGTLLINGNMSGATGAVTVAAGGSIGGSGTIGGATTVNGVLTPGNSPGTLTFASSLALGSSAYSLFEIDSLLSFDSVAVGTSLTYDGSLNLNFGYAPVLGSQFDLFNFSSQSGTFSSINFLDAGYDGTFNYGTGVLTVTAVPEPSTYAMLAAGLGVLVWLRRRGRC